MDDVRKISTSADWEAWEKLTNNQLACVSALSKVAEDGKFYTPAYYAEQQAVMNGTLDLNAQALVAYAQYQKTRLLK